MKLEEEVGISPYIIELEYANATEVQTLLLNITENISLDKSGNKLLVNASPKKIAEIKNIIKKVDVPALQIMLEAKLIEVSVSDEEKLGIDRAKLNQITTIVAENAAPLGVEGGGVTGSLLPGMSYVKDELGNIVETFEPKTTGQIPDQMYFQRNNTPIK